MELIELRIIATVVSFLVFLGILAWAYAGNQRGRFARDAQIIFEEDEPPSVERVVPFRRGSGHGLRTAAAGPGSPRAEQPSTGAGGPLHE